MYCPRAGPHKKVSILRRYEFPSNKREAATVTKAAVTYNLFWELISYVNIAMLI